MFGKITPTIAVRALTDVDDDAASAGKVAVLGMSLSTVIKNILRGLAKRNR